MKKTRPKEQYRLSDFGFHIRQHDLSLSLSKSKPKEMENQGIALDFALWQLRHENTSRTLEELHCVAFTKWKDIENQLDSTRKGLKALFEQLVQQENELLSKEKQLEAKELELKQLDGMQKSSQELSKEIEQKKKQCHDIEIRIKEKEREFEHINSSVLDAENKLDSLQSCMQEQSQKYQGMMKEYEQVTELKEDLLGKKQREIELKEDLLGKKQRSLEECIKEIELKEDLLSKKQRSIAKCTEDYELKKEQLELRESFIDGYNKEIKLKEEELKLKKHQLDLVQKLKAENSDSLEKLMENCACKLEKKEKNFKIFVEELSLKEQFLESKFKELDLLDKKVNECVEEVELKETNFASLQRLLEEQCHELEIKESEFERKANEFKLRQEEFEAIQRSAEMGIKEKTNIQTPSSSASHQSCVTKGKKDLFWLLHEYLQRHDLVCSQILSVLKASSSDPARLVLDTIHKIYNLHSSREDIEFEGSIARRGCSLLSELLIKASPEINPQVRQKAMKLAFAWKAKLNVASDNFEVLSLLQFLNSFRLASAFDVNELHYLLDAAGLITQTSQLRSPSSDITREECVQTLIQGGEIIRAVRLICQLKLRDMLSPIQLLFKFLEDTESSTQTAYKERKYYKAMKQAMDKELAILKAVRECIKFCNLESEILSNKISKRFGILENMDQSLDPEAEQSTNKKQRNSSFDPKESFVRCSQTDKLHDTVGADRSSAPLPQFLPPNVTTKSRLPIKIGTTTPPLVSKVANAVGGFNRSPGSAFTQSPFLSAWTKPPPGFVKLNFGYTGQPDCGFLSVVARDHNTTVLAIWCRKIAQTDPLVGEASAALGALTLASSKKWDAIYLEGDSLLLMSNLLRISEPVESISSMVSDIIAKMNSFRQIISAWIPAEANTLARNVSQWAADNNVGVGSSWIPVPSNLFYIFNKV